MINRAELAAAAAAAKTTGMMLKEKASELGADLLAMATCCLVESQAVLDLLKQAVVMIGLVPFCLTESTHAT